MKVVRTSPFTGKVHEMDIDVTASQLMDWHNGALIQEVMPNLTADEREFIKTGITPEEWEQFLNPNEQA